MVIPMRGRRKREKADARVIGRSDPEYERLWQIVEPNDRHRYTAYQQTTSRPTPGHRNHARVKIWGRRALPQPATRLSWLARDQSRTRARSQDLLGGSSETSSDSP